MKTCELQFVCGKQWDHLAPTALIAARYCGDCRKAVFMVKTKPQLAVASALGRCVAIADDNDFIGVVGEPGDAGGYAWMEPGFHETVSVKAAQGIATDRLAQLRLLFPKLFDGGPNEGRLLDGASVPVGTLDPEGRQQLRADLEAFAPELAWSSRV